MRDLNFTNYNRLLYKSMLLIAFYALLRIGEFTLTNKAPSHTLHLADISVPEHEKDKKPLHITIRHCKNSRGQTTFRLDNITDSKYCPVNTLTKYIHRRTKTKHPQLFINEDGSAVSSSQFSHTFKLMISHCGLNPDFYKPHSLRIGGATWAHERNLSDSQIQAIGRWRSTAFKRYIRVNLVHPSSQFK